MDQPAAQSAVVIASPAGSVTVRRSGAVGRLTLERPSKRNALNTHMLTELGERLVELADDTDIRVVTLCGAGPVFCAGADTVEFTSTPPEVIFGRWTRLGQQVFAALAALPQTSVAILNGSAYGGGLELAMHCDFRVAGADITLGLPEATLGTTPGWSGVRRIAEIAGVRAARLLAMTGKPVAVAEALRLGLVDIVAADAEAAAAQLVADLLGTTPAAQRILKHALSSTSPGAASTLIDSLAGAYLAERKETTIVRRTS